jgi:hypothetical protein
MPVTPPRAIASLALLLLPFAHASGQPADIDAERAASAYAWVRSDSNQPIPPDAVVGGREPDRLLYVCRAHYAGGTHPGKVVAGTCNIGYGGKEIVLPGYEILVGARAGSWRPLQDRGLAGAFVAGSEEGRPLFLCRAAYGDGIHPGKVVSGSCNFGWGGREISLRQFEVFTLPGSHGDMGRDQGARWDPWYPAPPSAPLTICADQPVPRGLVVLKGGRDMKCPNWTATGFNTFTVARPGESEEICASSPMPHGYVVVSEGLSWDCPNWTATGKNTKRIRRY